ncbi:T9SS type A sorting domain-containing protein, partial [bacterium]|nr:T9SS type A sorting domain-containing protein [bacterium]
DLVAVSYAVCKSEDQTLYWDAGFQQRHLNPQSSLEGGLFPADVWTDQTDLSTSLAVGDISYPDSLTSIEVNNCWENGIADGIIYLENFPFYRVDSVSFAAVSSPLSWETVSTDQWCTYAPDGWVSIDRELIETYTGPEYQWQEFWVRVSYKYSRYYDLAVGNDGVNVMYSAFGGGSAVIPANDVIAPDLPPYDPSNPYTYQTPGELEDPEANLMAADAIGGSGSFPFEPFEVAEYLDANPNVNRFGFTTFWDRIEMFKGHYFWDWLDKNLDELQQRGFNSHLCIFETPFWAMGNLNSAVPNARTCDERLHTLLVRNLVNRYRPNGIFSETGSYNWGDWGVSILQFENEPNVGFHGYGVSSSAFESIAEKIFRQYQMIKTISHACYPEDPDRLKIASPNFAQHGLPEYPDNYVCPPLPYLNLLNQTDLALIDNGSYDCDRVLWRFCDYIMQQVYCGFGGRSDDEFCVYQDPFEPVFANGDPDLKVGPEHLFWGWYTEGLSEYATGSPGNSAWEPVMRISNDPPEYSEHPFFLIEWSFFNDWYGEDLGVDDLLPQEDWISAQLAEIFAVDVFPKSDTMNHRLVAYSQNWLAGDVDYQSVFNTIAGLLNTPDAEVDTSDFYFEQYQVLDPGGADEPDVHSYSYTNAETLDRIHFVRTVSDTAAPATTIVGVDWDYTLMNDYQEGDFIDVYSPSGALIQKSVTLLDTIGCVSFAADEMASDMTILSESADTLTILNPGKIPGDPGQFQLHQNAPNPFNPITNIQFMLPVATRAVLSIYDVQGRKVDTLVEGMFQAGVHKVEFDASNLSSGIYFYKLEAGKFSAVRKLVLVK